MTLAARAFIDKWRAGSPAHGLNERAGAQAHFIDLCRLLGVPEPGEPERYCFERGVTRTGSERQRVDGFADVWLRGHFAWEYKAPGKSLEAALRQLMMYALPLENPPLLVVSDRQRIEIHTHFTGTPSECHVVLLEELLRPDAQARLRALWTEPERFRPRRSNREITEAAASTFAATAARLRAAGVADAAVSHFLTQCLFCFFAEDVGLLPLRLFERLVGVRVDAARLRAQLQQLFQTMQGGGLFGVDDIPWFNGGLFQHIDVPPLAEQDVAALRAASELDWSAIDPSIFGTLFERGLDPAKRSQLGAHYTDPATIARLVEPVVERPLLHAWAALRPTVEQAMARSKRHGDKAWRQAQAVFVGFLERLAAFRVLDPACGSGNFLFLALKALKDVEHRVNLEAEALGLERQHDVTGPHNVRGIELNEYAAELARLTVWIGELQWRIQHGYAFKLNPVLEPLEHIECRDALLNADGSEAAWPTVDAVVGNPPFVGDKKMRGELGAAYTEQLRRCYQGRVPGGADLVCYWFEKARAQIEAGTLQRAGLVATNSIRGGRNREVLDRIVGTTRIFEAWSDEPWVNEGAAVRVSLVAFGHADASAQLDGQRFETINSALEGVAAGKLGVDLTEVARLRENVDSCFMGVTKVGPFDIPGQQARAWLAMPPLAGHGNETVLRPSWNGLDVTRRPRDTWIIDFGVDLGEAQAMLYEAPFAHALATIKPFRSTNNRDVYREYWWRHGEARPKLRRLIAPLVRYIATPEVAKHRVFVWCPTSVLPDKNLQCTPRADDATFGILHSRLHELWSLRMCTWMGKGNDPRYTPTTTFETFAFPAGLTPRDSAHQRTEAIEGGARIPADLSAEVRAHAQAIARAAKRLVDLREAWLNPPEWCERVPEVVPLGMTHSPYPERIVARAGFEKELAARTLTKLYNQRPAWLQQAHAALDAAVAAAYGWGDWSASANGLADEEILRRLLALNQERAARPLTAA